MYCQVVREHDPQGREVEWFRHHLYAASKLGPTVKGSVSAELVDGLVIEEDPSYAFFATHLHSFLESYGIGDLVIPGMSSILEIHLFFLNPLIVFFLFGCPL